MCLWVVGQFHLTAFFPSASGHITMWRSLMARTRVALTAGPLLMLTLLHVPRTAKKRRIPGTWSDHWSPGLSMPSWLKPNCLHLMSTRFTEPKARSSTSAPTPPVSLTTIKNNISVFYRLCTEYWIQWRYNFTNGCWRNYIQTQYCFDLTSLT